MLPPRWHGGRNGVEQPFMADSKGDGGGKGSARSSVLDHRFGSGPPLTVGIEEEYMLLDPAGFDLVSGVEELLAEAAEGELANRLKPELMQCVLESGTIVCHDIAAAATDLRLIRQYVGHQARHAQDAPRRGRHAPVLAVREPEDHGPRPLSGAGRDAPVRRPPRARVRDARPRRRAHAGGLPGGDGGRADRAARAARALGQLAVLARRPHRPRIEPGDDLLGLPPQRPAAPLRRLQRLRRRGRLHGGDGSDRRLHAPVVGRAPASALRHPRAAGDGLPDAGRGRHRARRLRRSAW